MEGIVYKQLYKQRFECNFCRASGCGKNMAIKSMPVEIEKQFYIFDYQNYSQNSVEMRIQGNIMNI